MLAFVRQVIKGPREQFRVACKPGGVHVSARRFVGDPKRPDGMVYLGVYGTLEGPMAAMGTAALSQGYRHERLYHGDRFHHIEAQGPNAPDGGRSCVVKGRLTKSWIVVACPVRYGVSGVLSYMVNQEGVVYHGNMGSRTGKACPAMTRFAPGPGWTRGAWE